MSFPPLSAIHMKNSGGNKINEKGFVFYIKDIEIYRKVCGNNE